MVLLLFNVVQMNKTLSEILKSREDLSDYLFHFTKGRNAKDLLMSIINDNAIKDVNHMGSICFTESPVTMLAPMFSIFKRYTNPMYAPYGIGIRKSLIYAMGGRPVIYGDSTDQNQLPDSMQWRFELFSPQQHDFTWLREWRLQKTNIELSYNNCFVIVDTNNDILELRHLFYDVDDIDVDAQPEDGGVRTEYHIYCSRKYKVVSMEDILKVCLLNKKQLQKELLEQPIQDHLYYSTWE